MGDILGPCPPKGKLCLPKRGLCPEEINLLGASGVQIEALDSQSRAYRRRIREQELFFRNFCGLTADFMKLRVYFGTETFFFWSSMYCRIREKSEDFRDEKQN